MQWQVSRARCHAIMSQCCVFGDYQVEAQQLGEAQRRKLVAQIDRLQAEQSMASSGSARQLEALQVVHWHSHNNACG